MKKYVIDASVAVKWYVPEAHSETAAGLLAARDRGQARFHVPDLFASEVGSILWKKVRRELLDDAEAQAIGTELLRVPMRVHNSRPWFPIALRLSCEAGLTFYDSLYVTLASGLRCELVTADERLATAAGRRRWDLVRFVGSLT